MVSQNGYTGYQPTKRHVELLPASAQPAGLYGKRYVSHDRRVASKIEVLSASVLLRLQPVNESAELEGDTVACNGSNFVTLVDRKSGLSAPYRFKRRNARPGDPRALILSN